MIIGRLGPITMSIALFKKHKEKEGTPTMGGLIFIIPTILSIVNVWIVNANTNKQIKNQNEIKEVEKWCIENNIPYSM
mgnify:CR=1 FL=1